MQKSSISKASSCTKGPKRGVVGIFNNEKKSDFVSFTKGNEEFNRRIFEHFFIPRGSASFVFSPPLFALMMSFLALGGGGQDSLDEVSDEIIDAISLPCDYLHLKQDIQRIRKEFSDEYNIEAFIHHQYNAERFKITTIQDINVSRFADKFTFALERQKRSSVVESYLEMKTTYGMTHFALSAALNLSLDRSSTYYDHPSPNKLIVDLPVEQIFCRSVTIFTIDQLDSRAIVLDTDRYSLVILEPSTVLAFELLQDELGTFELASRFSNNTQEFPVAFKGQARISLSSKIPIIQNYFNMALPLQAFGATKAFEQSTDFAQKSMDCKEPLRVEKVWQDSNFDLHSVLKANFHEEPDPGQQPTSIVVNIGAPFLFYIQSSGSPALIHVFGRVGQE
jgi:hypothetical protein